MKTRLSALAAALVLGAAAMTPALAYDGQPRFMAFAPDEIEAVSEYGVIEGPTRFGCPMNSASEGNANQQNRPVPQYGQTSGGSAC